MLQVIYNENYEIARNIFVISIFKVRTPKLLNVKYVINLQNIFDMSKDAMYLLWCKIFYSSYIVGHNIKCCIR